MLTFMMIPDTEKFLRLVSKSRGHVEVQLPDGSRCDLKENRTARQLLQVLSPGEDGLRITLSDQRDLPGFFRYMREAAL